MSFVDLIDIGGNPSEVEDMGHGMSFWTDGDIVRFGEDVINGYCIEISLEDMEAFADRVELCETGKSSFGGRFGKNTYLFESDHPNVYVYHSQNHVASFTDYEKYPLSTITKRVREEQVDWNVEKRAEKIVSEHVGPSDEVNVEDTNEHIARVTIESEYFNPIKMIKIAEIESLRYGYIPEDLEIESKDDFTNHVKRFLENVSVQTNDIEGVQYTVKVDTSVFDDN